MEGNQQSFWQFSDQLRLQASGLANLSLNDSIWSVNHPYAATKRPESRRNFDVEGSDHFKHHNNTNVTSGDSNTNVNASPNFNTFKESWKVGSSQNEVGINLNGGFNKGVYSKPGNNNYNYNNYNQGYFSNFNVGFKGTKSNNIQEEHGIGGGKVGRKNKEVKKENKDSKDKNGESNKSGVDKRFKSLPASEALPKNETVGGYIFVCNNDTMEENLKRQLFGLPPRYRDSVRQITPGLPLFLYNYSTHQLHGIYEAASFGGSNIDPSAWEDKKNPGESRFPAQVRVQTRKLCEPLDEDAFRPILHHYDGPKFRLELSVPEALSLLDIFEESHA